MLHARRKMAFFTGQLGCARWACWAALFFASKSWIFLSFSSNQSWFFFFVCPRISSDVVSIAVFKSSHRVSRVGTSMDGSWGCYCRFSWSLAFTIPQHSLPMSSFSIELPYVPIYMVLTFQQANFWSWLLFFGFDFMFLRPLWRCPLTAASQLGVEETSFV